MTVLDDITGRSAPWPPPQHADRIALQHDYATLFRNRRDEVLQRWSGDLLRYAGRDEDLIPYPAGKIVCRTLAAFLFGEDPAISHDDDDVAATLDGMSSGINLPARLLEGAVTQAYEGEVFLRPAWDSDLSPWPILTAVPGSQVIPKFRHGMLVDAVIVTTYTTDQGQTVYRHLEQHERGGITNRLYRGAPDRLGSSVPIGTIPQTADLDDEVDTGIERLLMVHVPLGRDAGSPHGVSMLDGLEALALAIHRLYSQEQHDAELARKRVAMPASYIGRDASGRAQWDRKTDVLALTDEAEGAVGSDRNPIVPIEFSDDTAMRDRIRGRLEDFLMAAGVSPQTINPNESGGAVSGTARKLAQATTLRTVAAAARYWQDATSRALALSLDVGRVHLGLEVPELSEIGDQPLPTVSLADGLLDDPVELAQILRDLDTAEAISVRQKVERLHPEWSEDEVLAEVAAILERTPNAPPPPSVGTFGSDLEVVDDGDEADGEGEVA